MKPFNFVVFGFTSNLAQLKIIPALYDLEEKGLLSDATRIIGIGRKPIKLALYIDEVLSLQSRQHVHGISPKIQASLTKRTDYYQEDFEKRDGTLYSRLKTISGNILYYLATYPDLYSKIFESLNKNGLNREKDAWVRLMIEKPFGHDLSSSKELHNVLCKYFNDGQIFRVDHYLGKQGIREIPKLSASGLEKIEIIGVEDFGIGKRGIYYDATGALIDVGQSHLLQMLAAAFGATTSKQRAEVINSLIPDSKKIIFGQYNGYQNEENVSAGSRTDTFFALKTQSRLLSFKNIPIFLLAGKNMDGSAREVIVYYTGRTQPVSYKIDIRDKYDPYEKLILEAVKGNHNYFVSEEEVEASWKFIDAVSVSKVKNPFKYDIGRLSVEDGFKLLH